MTSPSSAGTLSPQHAARIAASAISKEVAAARGYKTLTRKSELKALGFGAAQQLVPTLLLPIWGIGGEVALYHHRPDTPRVRDGKRNKYEFPGGSRMAVDVHPLIRQQARRPDVPLFITEGVRKADAAISAGLCCVAVIGTWNWRGTNEWGGKTALPDWDEIAFKDKDDAPRPVYIVYDSDVMIKESVHQALARLAAFLKRRGATVAFIYLPHGDGGEKVGLDDFLAAGHTAADLLALASTVLRLPESSGNTPKHPYTETPSGLVRTRQTPDGPQETPLTNFTARIVADIVEDDGVESRRTFELEACRAGRTGCASVPAYAFSLMNWPMETLGAGALLYPGLGAKDHTRAAIQLLSGDPPMRHVYSHTGWRQMGQENRREQGGEQGGAAWAYLHAGGAIGTADDDPVHVHLPDALARYALPTPPTGDALASAAGASLGLLDLLPDALAFSLLSAVYRSVLGTCDFSLHLAGPSGAFKSELAALAQQHFGAGLDARHLPASWTATDNALEGLAFAVKDAVMVVDDFAPSGSGLDVQRLHAKADRLLRGQGKNNGRLRMRADASLKAPKFPRGLIVSTGEDLPSGLSLQARLLALDIAPGCVDPAKLSACQRDAKAGLYAGALAGFLSWLAPCYGKVHAGLSAEKDALRDNAGLTKAHRRTPEIAANLGVGLRYFLRFCLEAGVIAEAEHTALWRRGWAALRDAAAAQTAHQAGSEPTQRFLELLAAVIASGKGHLASPLGDAPLNPTAWGWREVEVGSGEYQRIERKPMGDRLGWLEDGAVFLQQDAAYNAARKFGVDTGDGLVLTPRTLNKRLSERGLLASIDKERGTATIRRTFSGQRQTVLHLHSRCFNELQASADRSYVPSEKTAHSAQSDREAFPAEAWSVLEGQSRGQSEPLDGPKTAPKTALPLAGSQSKPGWTGRNGQLGQFVEDAERETWRP